eukprot:CAMPEP_0175441344 /NCGR_PEP_ID=MMETSP0095-20121207/57546_1 /TAXON_ID=311494 /ORGANISM="Alexandrium monilatum, Strain CCMP3105" /LENGTH=46 /DNA_ID= /DNA_START= /DNA_END= /DNA_ORIENTATION=
MAKLSQAAELQTVVPSASHYTASATAAAPRCDASLTSSAHPRRRGR